MRPFLIGLCTLALVAGSARAAMITVVNLDGPNEGFNDPTPVAQVGGNPGTTLGEQRLIAFQYAADAWGALPPKVQEIFRNEGTEDVPVQYRDWIDAYYRRLSATRR